MALSKKKIIIVSPHAKKILLHQNKEIFSDVDNPGNNSESRDPVEETTLKEKCLNCLLYPHKFTMLIVL